jgi:hypothetical protein
MDGDRLDAALFESMERIAMHTARVHYSSPRPGWGLMERYDAALDALVEFVTENGWPANDKPLFNAAGNGINKADRERVKHIAHRAFWVEPPGADDAIAEAVTDKIGIRQLCWAFTESEWQAVWALAEAIRRGGDYRAAAASLGLRDAVFQQRLYMARKRAFRLWVAPGETPRGRYAPMGGASRSRLHHALEERRRQERLRQEPAWP